MKNRSKAYAALAVIGAAILAITIFSSGVSALVTMHVVTDSQIDAEMKHSGGVYRPFVEAEFGYVAFSGLYMTDDKDAPAVWVMWGFGDDAVTCFYQKADGRDIDGDGRFDENDAPPDAYDVSYILRAPQPAYAEHNDWARRSSAKDTAEYYDMTEEETLALFNEGVLEAARGGRITARIGWAIGVAALVAGAILAAVDYAKHREEPEGETVEEEEETAEEEEAVEVDETTEENAAEEEAVGEEPEAEGETEGE